MHIIRQGQPKRRFTESATAEAFGGLGLAPVAFARVSRRLRSFITPADVGDISAAAVDVYSLADDGRKGIDRYSGASDTGPIS